MNSNIARLFSRLLTVCSFALVLALGVGVGVLPEAHAAPAQLTKGVHVIVKLSTPPPDGSGVTYGPSAGKTSTQAQPAANPECFAYVYATPGAPGLLSYNSSTNCTPDVIETLQTIFIRYCNNSNCSSFSNVTDQSCDTGDGEWSVSYCPFVSGHPNEPNGNWILIGLQSGHLYQAFLSSCSNFPIYGWACGYATWDARPN